MSFYNSRFYKSSQKEQARREGKHDASRKYEARITELEQELIDQADQHAIILAPTLNAKYRHQGCAIAQRACSSGCPYWGDFADRLIDHKEPER